MKWRRGVRSQYIEDRRGRSRGLKLGGGVGGLVAIVVALVFGQDVMRALQQGAPAPTTASARASDDLTQFVHFLVDDIQATWQRRFATMGQRYRVAKVVLFTDATDSGCGFASAAIGPFYCPPDDKVYIDLGFYDALRRRFGAPGDFAQAYVMAHEFGHHVQNVLGLSARTQRAKRRRSADANAMSIKLELQADCFAGLWAHDTARRDLLERGDIEEGLNAASAIGDDTLQKRARGRVQPESWTHGSSAQRMRWFERGYESGRFEDCDTFSAGAL